MSGTRRNRYALVGAGLSVGAPLGWFAIRLLQTQGAASTEWMAQPALYAYLGITTAVAFAGFGAVVGRLADQLDSANARLAQLALTDVVTGLKNTAYFKQHLEETCRASQRDGSRFALVMADLDHFKQVNDRYGHPVGDAVLRHVGAVLSSQLRAGEAAARVGGEEFAVLCAAGSDEEPLALAERIRLALAQHPVATTAGPVPVTASLGIARWVPGESSQSLTSRADEALYEAKRGGRNRVQVAPS